MRNSNIKQKVLLVIFTLLLVPNIVKADKITVSGGDWVTFSDYGIDTGTRHIRTSYKTTSKGKEVYCVMFTKDFSDGTFSNCTKKLKISTKKQRIVGEIVDFINSKSWSDNKKYAYKVAALNTYLGLSGSSKFSGGSPTVQSVIDAAKNKYNKQTDEKNIFVKGLKIAVKDDNKVLNRTKTANTYISNQVIFSGLVNKVDDNTSDGATPTYAYTVSGLKTGQTAQLCTGSSGTGCKNLPLTFSGVTSQTYYVKVTGVTEDTNFSIKISGAVSPKRSKGALYCSSDQQTLLVKTSGNSGWSTSKTVALNINVPEKEPNKVSHNITIAKVDENGDAVDGSTFVYSDPKPVSLSCSMNGAFYKCKYGPVNEDADQFYGKSYCFEETKAPVGYILPANNKLCYGVAAKNVSTTCYRNGDGTAPIVENDANYCDTNIVPICKKIKTYYKEEEVPATGDDTSGGGTGGEGTGGEGSGTAPTTRWVVDDSKPVENTYRLKGDTGCNIEDTTEDPTAENPYKYTSEELCGIFKNETTAPDVKANKYCANPSDYESIRVSNGNLFITRMNQKNSVIISKKAVTGDDEVPGAELKICTKADYDAKKNECTVAKTVGGTELSWTSTDTPMEFNGFTPGTYYIVETLPPSGYKLVKTATEFSIDAAGTVKTGKTTASDNIVVVHNEINSLTISKTDMATTKELPGAKMSICTIVDTTPNDPDDTTTEPSSEDSDDSGEDDGKEPTANKSDSTDDGKPKLNLDMDGKCIPVRLADGTDATWTSGTEPKVISGLPAGTYYLVETTAPFGYSTSESILFTMKEDGTLTDKDGKSLANNKLEMKDKPITDVKTGMLPIIIISILGVGSIGGAVYFFRRSSYNNNLPRRRKKSI